MQYTTSEKVKKYLRLNNKTQVWLAGQLNITQPALAKKLRDDNFETWEIKFLIEKGIV